MRATSVPGRRDKEWYLYAARAGLLIGVANHCARDVSLNTIARGENRTSRPALPPFSPTMARRRRCLQLLRLSGHRSRRHDLAGNRGLCDKIMLHAGRTARISAAPVRQGKGFAGGQAHSQDCDQPITQSISAWVRKTPRSQLPAIWSSAKFAPFLSRTATE